MNQAEVNIDYDALIAGTSSALRDAGRIILAASVERSQIEKKSDSNYVTEIDYRVQEFLAVRLEDILRAANLSRKSRRPMSMWLSFRPGFLIL
jgi:3'-phosphoadenosine 5'-phosphosulfate (PAPS) 3'-phosphatase